MPTDGHPPDERARRLDAIRTAILGRLDAGRPADLDAYRVSDPDLVADLEPWFAAELARHQTIAPGGAMAAPNLDPGEATGEFPTPPTQVAPPEETVAIGQGGLPPAAAELTADFDLGSTVAVPPARPNRETRAGVPGPANEETQASFDLDSGLARDPEETVAQPQGPPGPGRKVRYLGDYELLKILGQGGMGVVYRARQISLDRPVALKMIRNAEFAGEEQLRRFQNEAEAVAQLDHPGIVPIYEVGTFEDQRYFSMKLIEGDALDRRLAHYKDHPREAAELVAGIADAVHHAHQRGILHRDLKPANILLDTQGRPHVTDYGLAKKIEGDDGMTVSGTVLGTPAYMAPEQALGRISQITTATDIYGLGAILYAALTGRAPFAADSVLETLEQVRQRAPDAPTRLNDRLPADLGVICLKCLEKDPRRRYATARDLADDLRRWLDGLPIAARPVGPAVRAAMWARRNPALAGLSALLAVAVVAGAVGVTVQWREAVLQRDLARTARDLARSEEQAARAAEADARRSRDQAVRSEADARSARDLALASAQAERKAKEEAFASERAAQQARASAVQNEQLAATQATEALGTIQAMVREVQTNLAEPGLFEVKERLLELAQGRIGRVADVYEKTTSKEATTAAVLVELGKLYRQLGRTERAFAQFQKCLEITRERVKIRNGSDPSRQNLAMNCAELALCHEELRRDMKAALAFNDEALRIWQDVDLHPKLDDHPLPKPFVQAQLAEAEMRVGINLYRLGDLSGALDHYRRAYTIRRALADQAPDNPKLRQDLSFSTMALAEAAFRTGDPAAAGTLYQEALDQRRRMVERFPKVAGTKGELAGVLYLFGEMLARSGDLPRAIAMLEEGREIRRALADADPRNAVLRRDLGMSFYRLGNLLDRANRPAEARASFAEALKIREELARISENNDRRQMELMLALAHAGQVDRAVAIVDRLAAGPAPDNELRIDLARCLAQCARATPSEDAAQVRGLLDRALDQVRAATVNGYKDRVYLETEPDLDPLRARDDFAALARGLAPDPKPAR